MAADESPGGKQLKTASTASKPTYMTDGLLLSRSRCGETGQNLAITSWNSVNINSIWSIYGSNIHLNVEKKDVHEHVHFRPKYAIFHTLFQTWLSKCIPYFRPCDVWQIRQLWMDLRRTGLRDAPNDVRGLFSSRSMSTVTLLRYPRPNRRNMHHISDQNGKSIPYFTLEMLENGTLWGGTYLHGLYMGVPPPPGNQAREEVSVSTSGCPARSTDMYWDPLHPTPTLLSVNYTTRRLSYIGVLFVIINW